MKKRYSDKEIEEYIIDMEEGNGNFNNDIEAVIKNSIKYTEMRINHKHVTAMLEKPLKVTLMYKLRIILSDNRKYFYAAAAVFFVLIISPRVMEETKISMVKKSQNYEIAASSAPQEALMMNEEMPQKEEVKEKKVNIKNIQREKPIQEKKVYAKRDDIDIMEEMEASAPAESAKEMAAPIAADRAEKVEKGEQNIAMMKSRASISAEANEIILSYTIKNNTDSKVILKYADSGNTVKYEIEIDAREERILEISSNSINGEKEIRVTEAVDEKGIRRTVKSDKKVITIE